MRTLKTEAMTAPDATRQAEAVKPDPLSVGATLANVAFNWAQQPGYTLTSDDCAMLSNLRKEWDESRRAAVSVQDMGDERALVQDEMISALALAHGIAPGMTIGGKNVVCCDPERFLPFCHDFIVRIRAAIQAGSASRAEPVATTQLSDPFDERSGAWFSKEDLIKLAALPAGANLYTAFDAAMPAQQADSDTVDAARYRTLKQHVGIFYPKTMDFPPDRFTVGNGLIPSHEVMLSIGANLDKAIDAAMSPQGGEG